MMRGIPVWLGLAFLIFGAVLVGGSGQALAQGDAAAGKKVFNKCRACHVIDEEKNRIGPTLHGVIGRKAGSVEDFNYSSAMKESGIVWTEETIAEYLVDPRAYVPGTKMMFVGLKDEEDIANLVAYLKEASQ